MGDQLDRGVLVVAASLGVMVLANERVDHIVVGVAGRRSYGTGSLTLPVDAHGRETWYGRFYSGGRQVKRRLGPRRAPGAEHGLTRTQAERALRLLIERERRLRSPSGSIWPRPARAICCISSG